MMRGLLFTKHVVLFTDSAFVGIARIQANPFPCFGEITCLVAILTSGERQRASEILHRQICTVDAWSVL